jgi:hypothetical protein
MAKIPDPFILEYRPPGEDYKSLPDALDDLYNRLNTLENVADQCQQLQDKETL